MQWFFILLSAGLLMLVLEVFLPGGVLGVLGGFALFAAVVAGYFLFDPQTASLIAMGVVVLSVLVLIGWIRWFPTSPIGRVLTLRKDARTFKSHDEHEDIVGVAGIAITTLRPSGIATIGGKRMDVLAEGDWVEQDSKIRVIKIEGNNVVVRAEPDQSSQGQT